MGGRAGSRGGCIFVYSRVPMSRSCVCLEFRLEVAVLLGNPHSHVSTIRVSWDQDKVLRYIQALTYLLWVQMKNAADADTKSLGL